MTHLTLFEIYKLIKNKMNWEENISRCQIILETVYSILNKDHWKVIGFTKAAVDELIKNDFSINKNGKMIVCRAHINQRRKTFIKIMNGKWNNGEEIYKYVVKMDTCLIATKKENTKNSKLKLYVKVPRNRNLFESRQIGFCFRKEFEQRWLREKIRFL